MNRQGFAEGDLGQLFVYQEIPGLTSTAIGIDNTDSGKLKLHVINGINCLPDSNSQIIIDPNTNVVTVINLAISGTIVIPGFGAGAVVTNSSGAVSVTNSTAGYVLTSNGTSSSPTFQAFAPVTIPWIEVTLAAANMSPNTGYISNNAGQVTLMMPTTIAQGDYIRVTGKGVGGWKIGQQSGQTIYFGVVTTTTGAGGYLSSTQQRDSIELVCITANTEFNVLSIQGNVTFN